MRIERTGDSGNEETITEADRHVLSASVGTVLQLVAGAAGSHPGCGHSATTAGRGLR